MSDEIRVSPNPIQRNSMDVAVELTQLYYSRYVFENVEEIRDTYSKFYAVSEVLHKTHSSKLTELLPDTVKKLLEKQ